MTWLTTPPCPLSTHFSQTPHKMRQHLFIGFKVMSRFRLLTSEGSIPSTVPSLLTPVPGRAVPSAPKQPVTIQPDPVLPFQILSHQILSHPDNIVSRQILSHPDNYFKRKEKNRDKVMPEPRKQFATTLMSLGVPFPFSVRILHCEYICRELSISELS